MPTFESELRWESDWDHLEFLDEIERVKHEHEQQQGTANGATDTVVCILHMSDEFLVNFVELDELAAQEVMDALKQVPIDKLELETYFLDENEDQICARLTLLFKELGCISSLHSFENCIINEEKAAWMLEYAFRNLHQIKLLSLHGSLGQLETADDVVARRVVASLEKHPSLEAVDVQFYDHDCCSILLPVLETMPLLRRVSCSVNFEYEAPELNPPDIRAIARLISSDLRLEYFKLQDVMIIDDGDKVRRPVDTVTAAAKGFYDALEHATVAHFETDSCMVGSAFQFASALAHSQIKTIQLGYDTKFSRGTRASFLATFTPRIPDMLQLEEFVCNMRSFSVFDGERYYGHDDAFVLIPGDPVVELVEAATLSTSLRRLKLEPARVRSAMLDEALTECLQHNKKLQVIEILCQDIPDEEISDEDISDESLLYDSQAVLEALKKNYTLHHLTVLDEYVNVQGQTMWEPDFLATANIICRLNRSGRGYVQNNPHDQEAGRALLAAVSDDLECIFYHAREYPLLCTRTPTASLICKPIAAADRKRKSRDDDTATDGIAL
jgi:hypothetical protein